MNSTTIKFLVSIKNSSMGSNEEVTVTYDAFGLSLLKILYNSGLIQGYNVLSKTKVTIFLRKVFNKILTKNIKLISKPTYKMILDYKKLSSSRNNTNSFKKI